MNICENYRATRGVPIDVEPELSFAFANNPLNIFRKNTSPESSRCRVKTDLHNTILSHAMSLQHFLGHDCREVLKHKILSILECEKTAREHLMTDVSHL